MNNLNSLSSALPSTVPGDQVDIGLSEPSLLEPQEAQVYEDTSIGKLPVEILTEIFLICTYIEYDPIKPQPPTPLYALARELPDLRPTASPVKLCHVCCQWRKLVLRTPILWSRFSLRGDVS